jgi:arylsulfatase A-like enzyme
MFLHSHPRICGVVLTISQTGYAGTALVGAALAAVLLGGCAERAEATRPNVVLIVVDTLRADRLPFYGSPTNTAPFLAELAERSLVFESAWSPSSWTLPATVSILTSVHPFQHGVNSLAGLELGPDDEPVPVNAIPEGVETLAETLRAAGYRTYGIASNLLVGPEVGFDRGFDRFVQLQDEDADGVNLIVESWREELLEDGPFFLYLHYFDPHDPFHARNPWFQAEGSQAEGGWPEEISLESTDDLDWILTRLEPMPPGLEGKKTGDLSQEELVDLLGWIRAAYDSEIGFVDSRIRQVFESLGLEDALVVFTADHGEEFYEHGDLTHGQNLYGETVRVPLLLQLPAGAKSGRVTVPVSTLDIVPTIRRALRLPDSEQDVGLDLLSDAKRNPVLGILEAKSGQHSLEDDLHSIVADNYRLITTVRGRAELYDLATDPWERTDLAEQLPDVRDALLRRLRRLERAAPRFQPAFLPPTKPSEALLEHLRGIGYLGD